MTAVVTIFYIAMVAYVAVLDILSLIYINNTHGALWAVATVLSGVGLVVAPFFAGLGYWYAPVLVIWAIVGYLSQKNN